MAPAIYCNISGNIGSLLHETGEHRKALKWLRLSNHWLGRVKREQPAYSNDDDIGNCLRALGHASAAVKYHRRAIRFYRATSNLIGTALALNNLGLAYIDLNKFRLAYQVLNESVHLKRTETADIPALMRGLLSLGIASARLEEHDEALKYFQEGSALSPVAQDDVTATHIQYEIAALYWSKNEKETAWRYYKAAERMARQAPLWREDRYRMKQIEGIKAMFLAQ
jgi:tetratricopeptide (TPR) repeat protein